MLILFSRLWAVYADSPSPVGPRLTASARFA